MAIMYIILKAISITAKDNSTTWPNVKLLLQTPQTRNLVLTNEFRELAKTREFLNVVKSLANDQVHEISNTLT